MKNLKLDHDTALRIRDNGTLPIWVLYDDKQFAVNDKVELIDKLDAQDPSSWKTIGIAIIDAIVEKRLGDMSAEEYDKNWLEGSTNQDVLLYLRQQYGPQVNAETSIKKLQVSFIERSSVVVDATNVILKEAKMYADGGSRGNPGPSASGFAILDMNDQIVVKKGVYLGVTTNNQAEYQALKLGIEQARHMQIRILHVYMDSMLVVNQMRKIFKVKNRDLWPIHESVKKLIPTFDQVTFMHVPRELNKIADSVVNEVLVAELSAK